MPSRDRAAAWLVTGAHGCLGAWTVAQLVREGERVVAFDVGEGLGRLPLVLDSDEIDRVVHVYGDVTDLGGVERALDTHDVGYVVHLAALQVPFCHADPPLGARVNVTGTVNLFEAVRRRQDRISHLVYASSIAVYDGLVAGRRPATTLLGMPATLYGVYKRANEGTAAVYAGEFGVPSVGLRPHTVFGPGRDQGLTAAPSLAMLAAVAKRDYRIPFGGSCQLQYAPDVAGAFVRAARRVPDGAEVHNLAGHVVSMDELIEAIDRAVPDSAGHITAMADELPFPPEVDATSWHTVFGSNGDRPLAEAVADSVRRFRGLLAAGQVSTAMLAG